MRLPPRLVALTPGTLTRDAPGARERLLGAVFAAASAGLEGVLVREPGLCDGELVLLARAVAERLAPAGERAWLAVHDRPHVAWAAGADAVHLGFRSLAPREVRGAFGEALAIGLSTHAPDDPGTWAGADYLFHGPVRDTPSKRGLLEPVGLAGLARACAAASAPVFAIGGLAPEDVRPVRAAGAHGLAVLRGILGADDPRAAALRFRAFLAAGGSPPGEARR